MSSTRVGVPGAVAGPRNPRDRHPVIAARHPRGVRFDEDLRPCPGPTPATAADPTRRHTQANADRTDRTGPEPNAPGAHARPVRRGPRRTRHAAPWSSVTPSSATHNLALRTSFPCQSSVRPSASQNLGGERRVALSGTRKQPTDVSGEPHTAGSDQPGNGTSVRSGFTGSRVERPDFLGNRRVSLRRSGDLSVEPSDELLVGDPTYIVR